MELTPRQAQQGTSHIIQERGAADSQPINAHHALIVSSKIRIRGGLLAIQRRAAADRIGPHERAGGIEGPPSPPCSSQGVSRVQIHLLTSRPDLSKMLHPAPRPSTLQHL